MVRIIHTVTGSDEVETCIERLWDAWQVYRTNTIKYVIDCYVSRNLMLPSVTRVVKKKACWNVKLNRKRLLMEINHLCWYNTNCNTTVRRFRWTQERPARICAILRWTKTLSIYHHFESLSSRVILPVDTYFSWSM